MFIRFSPIKPVKKAKPVPKDASEEFDTLSLAPFSQTPKLFFDNVKVGSNCVQRLLIKNSTNQDVTLYVNSTIPPEFQVMLSWDYMYIEKGSDVFFEVSWTPHLEQSGRYTITFEDCKRIKRDVPIAFKSILPDQRKGAKAKAKKKEKSPTKRYYSTRPPHISPRRISPCKRPSSSLKTSKRDSMYAFKGQENIPVVLPSIQRDTVHNNDRSSVFNFTSSRRETYTISKKKEEFDDSLNDDAGDDTFNLPGIESIVHNRQPLQCYQADNVQINHKSPSIEFKIKLLQAQFLSPSDSPCLVRPKSDNSYSSRQQNFQSCYENGSSPMIQTETNLDDMSFTTYVKHNDSRETYTISPHRNPNFNISSPSIAVSPLFPVEEDRSGASCEESWSPLGPISEESHFMLLSRKRKSTIDFDCGEASSKKANVVYDDEPSRLRVRKKTSESVSRRITIRDPCLFVADGTVIDPFMSQDLQVDPEWIARQEKNFMKWLNALLTPPAELASVEQKVDVSKVWQECKTRDVAVAPTKEAVSIRYHTSDRLNACRKAANELYSSPEIASVLAKVFQQIDQHKLTVREDKNVHLNLAIKSQIITLLLSYNPLWLRLGLETIYKEVILLNSNSDITGLTTFILNRLMKDPSLIKKHKTIHTPKYTSDFNKFFLKKILALVYFLDKAKNVKLIPHDPCLFNKNSAVKASKDLLFALAREIVSSIGDITKYLKHYGYQVNHMQTYIHEFDYAVHNIRSDLRDGVRLTRIAEIILLRTDLTGNLRVPAVSLLQKVHNMKIVFDAFEHAGFRVMHDIIPKDIVIGIREKTLSLLWQIIYKFETPLMVKSATTVQRWYRSLPVVLKRRQMERKRQRMVDAAVTLQRWFRRRRFAQKLQQFHDFFLRYRAHQKTEHAVVAIQSYYRMYRCRKTFLRLRKTTILLQARCRGWLIRNVFVKHQQKFMWAVTKTQQRFRAILEMKRQRSYYLRLKFAAIFVQRRYRAKKMAEVERKRYLELKTAVMVIQARFRANVAMKVARKQFFELRVAAVKIQVRFRAQLEMRKQRDYYFSLKNAVRIIEEYRKAHILMLTTRNDYICQKTAAVKIQRWFRANKAMEEQRTRYVELKNTCVFVQRKFRANQQEKKKRLELMRLRNASAIKIQTWFRSIKAMEKEKARYIALKNACVFIQRKFRENQQEKKKRLELMRLRNASAIKIQTWFRSIKAMEKEKARYIALKNACVFIQRKFRANRIAKMEREHYLRLRHAAIVIQQRFRARQSMCITRAAFITLRMSTISIQRHYRATVQMRRERASYLLLRSSVIKIQTFFRTQLAIRKDRENYLRFKRTVVMVQQRWRATRECKIIRNYFVSLREKAIVVQQRWRAKIVGRKERERYTELRNAAIKIQRAWRSFVEGRKCRKEYLRKREAVIMIQAMWKGYKCRSELKEMEQVRQRLQQAYKDFDEERTLKNETSRILQMFFAENASYLQISKSLVFIDNTIKNSKELNYHLSRILPDAIYIMLSTTARSDPEMQICILSVNILLTFYRYPPSRNNSFVPKYMDSLLTLMLHWCDKDAMLFPSVSTLVWMFAHNQAWKQTILSVPKFGQLFQKIGQSIARKENMVRRVPPKSISLFGPYKNLPLPSLQPDWGLQSTRRRARVFLNSIQAYKALYEILMS